MQTDFSDKEDRTDDLNETLNELLTSLVDDVDEASSSETLKEWLDLFSQFHNYSLNNLALARIQLASREGDREVSHLAGFKQWENKFDRNVKRGEKALWIRSPSKTITKCSTCDDYKNKCECGEEASDYYSFTTFYSVPVYDVSQTEGEPLPTLNIEDITGDAGLLPDALIETITNDDITVRITPEQSWTHGTSKGICDHANNEIEALNAPGPQLARVLIHEYAHALTHENDHDVTEQARREVEADATAYVVGRYYGLDMEGTTFYIARWQADSPGVLRKRLGRISRDARKIIEQVDAVLEELEEIEFASEPLAAV